MAKFNAKQTNKYLTKTYEGGTGYTRDINEALMNFMFSSYLADQYYESAEKQQARYMELLDAVSAQEGYDFVAKLADFARNELGMRSTSALAMAYLNDKTFDDKRKKYANFFHRPDDVAEVFGAIDAIGQKRSHALVRGAGDYLSTLKDYSLGKYKMSGRTYNMYDLINITHAWSPTIQKYKNGTLVSPDTWEVKISTAKSEEEKDQEWKRLVEEGKLGYMALLRNLRNIRESGMRAGFWTNEWIFNNLLLQLTNREAIKKSMVFPYRIYACAKALVRDGSLYNNWGNIPIILLQALDSAFRISIENMPKLDGKSLVVLDVSGSMESPFSENSIFSIKEISAVYACAVYVGSNCDFYKFGNHYKKQDFDKTTTVFNIIDVMMTNDDCGYGTEIVPVFEHLVDINQSYDRIFLFSDMQVMEGSGYSYYYHRSNATPQGILKTYYQTIGHQIPIYSFDCGNYHSQLTSPDCNCLKYITALNEKVMKFIELYESGMSLIDYIKQHY